MNLERYTAKFEISGGISEGFALKYPLIKIKEKIFHLNSESTAEIAYMEAMYQARLLAENHLSNPETKKTTVKLLELYRQKEKVNLENKQVIVECSMLEHLFNSHMSRQEFYPILPKYEF